MILQIGNNNVTVTRETDRTTKLSVAGPHGTEIVHMDKAETAALIAALKVEAPK